MAWTLADWCLLKNRGDLGVCVLAKKSKVCVFVSLILACKKGTFIVCVFVYSNIDAYPRSSGGMNSLRICL